MMLARPEGLIPSVRRTRELRQHEMAQDAWLRGEVDDDNANGTDDGGSQRAVQP